MSKIKNFINNHRKGLIIGGAILVGLGLGTFVYNSKANPFKQESMEDSTEDAEESNEEA